MASVVGKLAPEKIHGELVKGAFGEHKSILVSSSNEYAQFHRSLLGSYKILQERSLLVGSPKHRGESLGKAGVSAI